MDFDITWKEPTEAQAAALEHSAHARKWLDRQISRHGGDDGEFIRPITEFEIAEMMCMGDGSFWYTQAKAWADGGPVPASNLESIFRLAGRVIVKMVGLGYSNGKWYDATQIWHDTTQIAINLCSIVEVVRVLRIVRAKTFQVNSAWFEVIPYLMIPGLDVEKAIKALSSNREGAAAFVVGQIKALYDPEFKKELNKTIRVAKDKLAQTYEPSVCIHPKCDNLVAPKGIKPREGHYKNYRGTGACRKGHNSYFCTKCNGPHSFVSKVGQSHLDEFYGKDWDGTDMNGNRVW